MVLTPLSMIILAVGVVFAAVIMIVIHAVENAAELDENGNLYPPKNKRK